jgi:hypothetical protein
MDWPQIDEYVENGVVVKVYKAGYAYYAPSWGAALLRGNCHEKTLRVSDKIKMRMKDKSGEIPLKF